MNTNIIVIPKIKIQNANALSSALTVGFPAITAWGGAVHALERHLKTQLPTLKLERFSVVSHQFDIHAYKGKNDYGYSLIGMGFPLDKDGDRSPFIEDARCHLTVSLVIECANPNYEEKDKITSLINGILKSQMKIAGGDILKFDEPEIHIIQEEDHFKKLKRRLMPGYFLVERRDLVIDAMNAGCDALDAVLESLKVKHRSESETNDQDIVWTQSRLHPGWIVPVAVGFQALTPLAEAKNQRDDSTPHRFAEAVVTLGEFKMIHRLNSIEEFFWSFVKDIENDLYVYTQQH